MKIKSNFKWLVLGGGGGGRPDYLQKLKVPEGYEKMIDYSNILHGTADGLKLQRGASRGRLYRSRTLQVNTR